MRHPLQKLGLTAMVLLAGAGVASAQDSRFNVDFKLRAAQELGKGNDNLDKRMIGLGLNFGYQLPYGTLNAEIGFQYKSGKQFQTDLSQMALGPDLAPASSTTAGIYIPMNAAISTDSRKNTMDGITLRLSYSVPLPVDKLSVQAGIQLGGTKFRQEFFGDIGDTYIQHRTPPLADRTFNWYTYEDSYVGVNYKNELGSSLSPFVGISYRLDESSSLEMNVLVQRFKSINYVHVAGAANALDYTVLANRTAPHLEIGYTFRF